MKNLKLSHFWAVVFNFLVMFCYRAILFIYFAKVLALRVTVIHNVITEAKGATENK